MSLSPTVIIPLQTTSDNTFGVRTLLDSGSGTNWIVKSILKHVCHTKRGSELMEVHTFHGAVSKNYPKVEVYYTDNHGITQSIMCFVHDAYIRHIKLNMADYIQGERQNGVPFTLPGPLSDPGDPNVGHGYESQGVGLVLCSASINKLRTSDPIIHMKRLDILLEPTIFGVVISGTIPDHLRSTADRVSVNCIAPRIIKEVSSLETSKKRTLPEFNFPLDGKANDIPVKGTLKFVKKYSKDFNSIDENLKPSNQVVDYTTCFILLMFIFTLLATLPINSFFYILVALGNIFHIMLSRDFFSSLKRVSSKPKKGKVQRHSKNCVCVNASKHTKQRINKFHAKANYLGITLYHRPRLKYIKNLHIDSHTGKMSHYLNSNKPSKFALKDLLRRVLHNSIF